jgi:RNA-binding protein
MEALSKSQKRWLRGQAHHLDPVVQVGKQGVTDTVVHALEQALEAHELVKVKFMEFKDEKTPLTQELAERTNSEVAGVIGHVAIFYRQQRDPEKRRLDLPSA